MLRNGFRVFGRGIVRLARIQCVKTRRTLGHVNIVRFFAEFCGEDEMAYGNATFFRQLALPMVQVNEEQCQRG